MGTSAKILGKSKPEATTETVLYTTPEAIETTLHLFACNQSASADTVRVAVVSQGAALALSDYMLYDYSLSGNGYAKLSGISLEAGDFIVVYSTNGTSSFVAMGMETG